ncbi:MAG: glycosyltransferase family 2 protein [Thermoprotei archaeon]
MLTLNSEVSISYVLDFLLSQDYSRDKILYLVVDGGSSDNTLGVVREVFTKHQDRVFDVVVAAGSNIPQARNVCLERLLQAGVDYVLFVDSDILVVAKNAFQLITRLAEEKHTLIHFTYSFKYFSNPEELRKFIEELRLFEVSVTHKDLIPSLQIGMGFTAIPREIATTLRFDEDMDFSEDYLYALKAYSRGYVPHIMNGSTFLYDINVRGKRSDIYWKLPFRRYLRSARKKALVSLAKCVEDNSLKLSVKKLSEKLVKHSVNVLLLATLYLLPVLVFIDLNLFQVFLMIRVLSMLGYAVFKKFQGFTLLDGLKNRIKFEHFSALIILNLPLALLHWLHLRAPQLRQ